MKKVTLVQWQRLIDMFRCTVADAAHRIHTIEMPLSILNKSPKDFLRGKDNEHIGTIAAGPVLLRYNTDEQFHKIDNSHVDLAYDAASKAQIIGRFEKY
ncbi:MAG: hypothetical protein ABI778_11380 [Ignavibacteriota bacterium]